MHRPLILGATLLALLAAAAYSAQQAGRTVVLREPRNDDVYLAGRGVEVLADVTGDVVAAGRRVEIAAAVGGDAILAAGHVRLGGSVSDDLRAAGREVEINGEIGDHMVAAGRRVTLTQEASVGRFAWLAGDTVFVDGSIDGELKAAGSGVRIAAEIGGDVDVAAEEIDVLPGARIEGDLVWRGDTEPRIHAEATVVGEVRRAPVPEALETDGAELPFGLIAVLGVLVAGGVLVLAFPQAARAIGGAPVASPWRALTVGALILLVTPFAVALLLGTVVGGLLALILLPLYLAALLAGVPAGALALGELGLRRLREAATATRVERLTAFALATILIALVAVVPLLGSLALLLVWLAGIGALPLGVWRGYTASAPSGDGIGG